MTPFAVAVALVTIGVTLVVAAVAPRVLAARSPRAVGLLMAGAAVAAVAAGSRPTGAGAVDVVLRTGFAALVAGAASRARAWAWIVASGTAAVAAYDSPSGAAALAALGVSAAAAGEERGPVLGALIGGLVAQSLLRLESPDGPGATAAVAAVAASILLVSGWRQLPERQRGAGRKVAGGIAAAAGVAVVLFLISVVRAGPHLLDAYRASRAGIDAATGGNGAASASSADHLDDAARSFRLAHRALGAWWARPARAVPVVAQHAAAGERLSGALAEVAASAGVTARQAAGPELRLRGGSVDLAAVGRLAEPVARSLRHLEHAAGVTRDVGSPWLVAPIERQRQRLEKELTDAAAGTRALAMAVDVVPGLLGLDGPRRYFVGVQALSEQRGSGGFMGQFAEVVADQGRLSLTRVGGIGELDPQRGPPRPVNAPPDYLARYGAVGPGQFFGNVTLSPDFPTVASVIEDLYPRSGGQPVDGVISVDPLALAALLRVTGPVVVPGWPEPLTAANAARVLLHDHYVVLSGPAEKRFEAAATAAIFERFTAIDLADPTQLVRALAPAVRRRHLMFHASDAGAQRLFAHIGADGAMAPVRSDFVQVVTQNSAESKIDWFQRRAVTYDATWEPGTGRVRARVTLRLTNLAPPGGLPEVVIGGKGFVTPDLGQSRVWVSLYTPHDLQGATLDGVGFPLTTERELGRQVHSGFVTLGPGRTSVLEVHLAGVVPAGARYFVDVGHQPTITPDELTVHVHPWADERLEPLPPLKPDGRGASARMAQDSPATLGAKAARHRRLVRPWL